MAASGRHWQQRCWRQVLAGGGGLERRPWPCAPPRAPSSADPIAFPTRVPRACSQLPPPPCSMRAAPLASRGCSLFHHMGGGVAVLGSARRGAARPRERPRVDQLLERFKIDALSTHSAAGGRRAVAAPEGRRVARGRRLQLLGCCGRAHAAGGGQEGRPWPLARLSRGVVCAEAAAEGSKMGVVSMERGRRSVKKTSHPIKTDPVPQSTHVTEPPYAWARLNSPGPAHATSGTLNRPLCLGPPPVALHLMATAQH